MVYGARVVSEPVVCSGIQRRESSGQRNCKEAVKAPAAAAKRPAVNR